MAQGRGSGLRLIARLKPAAALLFGLALVCPLACRRHGGAGSSDVSVETEIAPRPVAVGSASLAVRLADARGNPLTNARISVEGEMSHPGMSPVFAEAEELSGGRYRARLEFAMAGDWVLLLHIKLPGGQTLERQVDVKGVEAK